MFTLSAIVEAIRGTPTAGALLSLLDAALGPRKKQSPPLLPQTPAEFSEFMKAHEVPLPAPLEPDDLAALFASQVMTPIGPVKFGGGQQSKLGDKGRDMYSGAIEGVLKNPLMILKEPSQGARPFSYLFIKAISTTGRASGLMCVTVQREGEEVVVSNRPVRSNQLFTKIKSGVDVIYSAENGGIERGDRIHAHELAQPDSPSHATESTSAPLGPLNISAEGQDRKMLESIGGEMVLAGVDFVATPPALFDHGRVSHVVTGKGAEVTTAFIIVEADTLIPSNSLDGRINAGFPQELQPRDRTRQSSVMQIAKLSKSLRPAQLGDSGLSSHGAPIIGPDSAVESGNGRSMAIIKAYAEGNADGYRQYLEGNAELYGQDPAKVKGMSKPVLVRVRLDDVDRVQFAKDSNLSDLQSMSPTELARVDAEAIDERLMGLFSPSDSGDLLAASNRPFISAFMASLGAEQAAGFMTADGRPTKQIIDRVQAAIFAKAYQSETLLQLAVEEPDPEIRNILTALNVAAPTFIEMRYLSGEAHKQTTDSIAGGTELTKGLDAQALGALVDATTVVREAKASGQDVTEYLSQRGLFGDVDPYAAALAKFIAANNRSAKRMGEAFKAMAEEINGELQHQGAAANDMFGGEPLDLFTVLARVGQRMEAEHGKKAGMQVSMFESAAKAGDVSISLVMATSTAGLVQLLDFYMTPDCLQQDSLDKLLKGPILALKAAQSLPELDAAIQAYDVAAGALKSRMGPTKRLPNTDMSEWFPGADPQPNWWLSIGAAARQREIMMEAQAVRQEGGPGASKALDALRVRFDQGKNLSGPAEQSWVSSGALTPHAINDLFLPLGLEDLAADQARYQAMIESLNIQADERDHLALAAKDLFAKDAVLSTLQGMKEFKALPPEDIQRAAEMMADLGARFAAEKAPLSAIQTLSYDFYSESPTSQRHKAANAMLALYYRKAFDLRTSRYIGMEPIQEELERLISDSPFSARQANDKVGKCAIRITQARLFGSYSMSEMKQDMATFFQLVGGASKEVEIAYKSKRASANRSGRINSGANLGKSTLWHEMGHVVEYENPELLMLAKRLLLARHDAIPAGKRKIVSLKTMTGARGYSADEVAINDGFYHPYVGKVYGHSRTIDQASATEVFSMGFEMLSSPIKLAHLAMKDPEHLALTLAAVKLLQKKGGKA